MKKWGSIRVENKGFSYFVTDEQIREYMKLTTEEKLQWLEEANEFIEAASDEKTKEIREKFRRGKI